MRKKILKLVIQINKKIYKHFNNNLKNQNLIQNHPIKINNVQMQMMKRMNFHLMMIGLKKTI